MVQQNAYPIPRSIETFNYDSCPTLRQENNSVTCPSFTYYMEQCTAMNRHSTTLLLISRSMDVHPNPGPTAVHIIRDLTTPEQRKLFNNVKRLQLKVARYEHHISNYKYYHMHKMIPKGLAIKCRPSIDGHSEHFLRNCAKLLKKTSFKMMNLLKQACQDHYKRVKSKSPSSHLMVSGYYSMNLCLFSNCFSVKAQ